MMHKKPWSTEGPSDLSCIDLDKRMRKMPNMEIIHSLGYKSFHACIRDLIISGKTQPEIALLIGSTLDTVKNSRKKMHMNARMMRVLYREKEIKSKRKYQKRDDIKTVSYKEHKCWNPECNNITTNRALCNKCYENNSDEVTYDF